MLPTGIIIIIVFMSVLALFVIVDINATKQRKENVHNFFSKYYFNKNAIDDDDNFKPLKECNEPQSKANQFLNEFSGVFSNDNLQDS